MTERTKPTVPSTATTPSTPTAEENLADSYFLRGRIEYKAGNYQSAINDFNETIRLWPKSYRAYEGRAAAYNGLGNYSQAAQDRKKAEELRGEK